MRKNAYSSLPLTSSKGSFFLRDALFWLRGRVISTTLDRLLFEPVDLGENLVEKDTTFVILSSGGLLGGKNTKKKRSKMVQFSCCHSIARVFGWCGGDSGGDAAGDGLLWDMKLKPHASGDFSIAVAQANSSLEDQGQVLTSPFGTFVGVFDGHGGPEASRFVNTRLFGHLQSEFRDEILTLFLLRKWIGLIIDFFFGNA